MYLQVKALQSMQRAGRRMFERLNQLDKRNEDGRATFWCLATEEQEALREALRNNTDPLLQPLWAQLCEDIETNFGDDPSQ